MAPVEIEVIPRDVVAAPLTHLKIVNKAFELPLVSDTYNEVTRLAAPMSPFVETVKGNVDKVTPMLESGFITIKSKAEEKFFPQLPEGTTANIQAKVDIAMEKVTLAVDGFDTLACEGLDQLTAKIPALKEATPELIETAKDTTVTYAEYAKEYVASFSVAQIALKLGDKGLQIFADTLKLTGLDETKPVKPVLSGITTIRRNARAVRRAGAKAAGIEPAKTIGEASLLGAVAEIVGLNFFLSVVGLQLVPANMQTNAKTTELDTSIEEETVGEKLGNDRIASYVSDEDPDFVPSDVSVDSAEDESEGEEAIVEAVEKIEAVVEGAEVKIKNAVEEVVEEVEHVVEKVEEEIVNVVEAVTDAMDDIVEKIADKIEDFVEDHVDDVQESGEAKDAEKIADKTEDFVKDVEEEAGEADEKIENVVEAVTDAMDDIVEKIADKIEDFMEDVDNVQETGEAKDVEKIADKTEDIVKDVKEVEEAEEADEELD